MVYDPATYRQAQADRNRRIANPYSNQPIEATTAVPPNPYRNQPIQAGTAIPPNPPPARDLTSLYNSSRQASSPAGTQSVRGTATAPTQQYAPTGILGNQERLSGIPSYVYGSNAGRFDDNSLATAVGDDPVTQRMLGRQPEMPIVKRHNPYADPNSPLAGTAKLFQGLNAKEAARKQAENAEYAAALAAHKKKIAEDNIATVGKLKNREPTVDPAEIQTRAQDLRNQVGDISAMYNNYARAIRGTGQKVTFKEFANAYIGENPGKLSPDTIEYMKLSGPTLPAPSPTMLTSLGAAPSGVPLAVPVQGGTAVPPNPYSSQPIQAATSQAGAAIPPNPYSSQPIQAGTAVPSNPYSSQPIQAGTSQAATAIPPPVAAAPSGVPLAVPVQAEPVQGGVPSPTTTLQEYRAGLAAQSQARDDRSNQFHQDRSDVAAFNRYGTMPATQQGFDRFAGGLAMQGNPAANNYVTNSMKQASDFSLAGLRSDTEKYIADSQLKAAQQNFANEAERARSPEAVAALMGKLQAGQPLNVFNEVLESRTAQLIEENSLRPENNRLQPEQIKQQALADATHAKDRAEISWNLFSQNPRLQEFMGVNGQPQATSPNLPTPTGMGQPQSQPLSSVAPGLPIDMSLLDESAAIGTQADATQVRNYYTQFNALYGREPTSEEARARFSGRNPLPLNRISQEGLYQLRPLLNVPEEAAQREVFNQWLDRVSGPLQLPSRKDLSETMRQYFENKEASSPMY